MQRVSASNKRFLNEYHDVLSHHVMCILRSGMILDEDMNLLMTFWNPELLQKSRKSRRNLILSSVTFSTAAIMTSMKLRNFFPLLLSVIPATTQLALYAASHYWRKRYEKNFEKLLSVIRSIHDLNREIGQYYNKRDTAAHNQKLQMDAFNLLLKPGEDFLRYTLTTLVEIVDEVRKSMLRVCKLVPISEGEFICSLEWNLDDLHTFNDGSFNELKLRFEKLTDLYLLITSNFLSCIGLSFCVQLWKEPCCLPQIFNRVIPELGNFLQRSFNGIKSNFNLIRFNLCNETVFVNKVDKDRKVPGRLERPLSDFLVNLQITFETAKYLQVLIESKDNSYEEYLAILEDINKQVVASRDSLSILINRFAVLTKRVTIKEAVEELPVAPHKGDGNTVDCSNNEEDVICILGDEEYNLTIYESDSDDFVDYTEDPVDPRSTEDLSVVLLELKKKLMEHEGKLGKTAREESNSTGVIKSHPLPPPLPLELPERLPFMQDVTDVHGLLHAVTLTAQRLNRTEEFQFGFNMFPEIPRPFNTTYRCFSVAMLPGNERQDVERGGKIIMPPSALEQLTRLNINYPMQFKIVNKNTNRTTHCGVLEFVADEGKVYLPLWMMHNLVLEEGDLIQIESVSLPVGNFAKFQPLSPEFLDITNPKAVLENCLRTFSCLTTEDVIAVKYNQHVYELCVLETQPGKAISIVECDMNVEFAAPVGYKETEHIKPPEDGTAIDPADLMPEPAGFVAFRGAGNRLDGKRRKDSGSMDGAVPKPVYIRGIPDYDYQIGTLRFLRQVPKSSEENKEENEEFKAFSGEGFSLRHRN